MGHKPNTGKGIKPEEKAIAYKHTLENGDTIYAKVIAYKIGPSGNYQAWVQHPVFGCEQMTEKEGRLENFTPILAVTSDEIPAIVEQAVSAAVEKMGAVVADLQDRLKKAEDMLSAARVKAKAPPASGPTKTQEPAEDLDFLG